MKETSAPLTTSYLTGTVFVLSAAVLWGTTGTAQGLAPVESTPQVIGTLRLVVGGGALLLVSLWKNRCGFKNLAPGLICGSGLFVALYQVTFFWSVALTGVAVGTMVGIGSAPLFAGGLEKILNRGRLERRWFFSTGLAILGCCILLADSRHLEINPLGMMLAAGAGFSYALYSHLMKRQLNGRNSEAVAALVFCTGALFLSPLLFGVDLGWLREPAGLLVVGHLGILATGLSYLLFCKGLERIPVSTAVTLSIAEPMTAAILGVTLLGEHLRLSGWLGMALILSGLFVLSLQINRPRDLAG